MHTLNLPPGQLLRMALLALLLTVTAMVLAAAASPGTIEFGSGASAGAPAAAQETRATPGTPAWVEDPLAPPTLRLSR